jgi:hypothetical protein
MERSDDRLSTRDIASPTGADDARFERDEDAAARGGHEVTGDTMAAMADPAGAAAGRQPDRDLRDDGVARPDAGPDGQLRDRDVAPAAGRDAATAPAAPAPAAAGAPASGSGAATADGTQHAAPLLADGEGFQSRWEEIQVRFVDEPRGAVEDADALVATVMQRLAESFAQERERLEAQWGRGEDISTEDLRVALQRYRSFFQRLLAT